MTEFLHDGDQVCEERDESPGTPVGGDPLRQYIWGNYIDELIQQREFLAPDGTDHADLYPLSDLHYRTTALTDSQRRILEAYDTDAYGNTQVYKGCGPDGQWFTDDDVPLDLAAGDQLLCKHLYTGRYLDEETGLYYYRARYYSPEQGRFIQRDPAGYQDGMNLYEYTAGMPTKGVDPDGEAIVLTALGIAGLIWLAKESADAHVAAAELRLAEQELNTARSQRSIDSAVEKANAAAEEVSSSARNAVFATSMGIAPFAAGGGFFGTVLWGGATFGTAEGLATYSLGGDFGDITRATAQGAVVGMAVTATVGGIFWAGGIGARFTVRFTSRTLDRMTLKMVAGPTPLNAPLQQGTLLASGLGKQIRGVVEGGPLNRHLLKRHGIKEPPFGANNLVILEKLGKGMSPAPHRYWSNVSKNMPGRWLSPNGPVMSSQQAVNRLALPTPPTNYALAAINRTVTVWSGRAAPMPQWGRPGGAWQYFNFSQKTNPRPVSFKDMGSLK